MNYRKLSFSYLTALFFILLAMSVQAMPFGHGRLFKATSPQGQVLFVFGTMHSEAPEVTQLPFSVQQAFDRSSMLALEIETTPEVMLGALTMMMLTDGRDLSSIIGSPLYHQVVPLLEAHGLPETMVSRLKPWAVFALLSAPKQETGLFLDVLLYQQAQQEGKATHSLENMQEQLGVFDRLSDAQQIELLQQSLDQIGELDTLHAELQRRYLAGDLRGLMQMNDESMQGLEQSLVDAVMDGLLVKRNKRMVERVQPLLANTSTFMAVGALHLPGEQGILQLLKMRGFQVDRVY